MIVIANRITKQCCTPQHINYPFRGENIELYLRKESHNHVEVYLINPKHRAIFEILTELMEYEGIINFKTEVAEDLYWISCNQIHIFRCDYGKLDWSLL